MRSRVVEVREAKIDDFNIARFGNEDVLNLQVWGRVSMRAAIRRSGSIVPL